MAHRPTYIPQSKNEFLVKTEMVEFKYHSGFSVAQKQKSIDELHDSIQEKYGFDSILEVSSKSKKELGVALSAFNLMITDKTTKETYSVECAFQSSKVFENGGAYTDLLKMTSKQAKRDERLRNSGKLIGFEFHNTEWKLNPLTAFYDWLYINALNQNVQFHNELMKYQTFTDIEFNPKKSINCQAYSIAMFVALAKRNLLGNIRNPNDFLEFYKRFQVSNAYQLNENLILF
ncbi:MAG: DarT1-associated NADAR antitoxin family protein [Psychrobacter sp.]|uniref:DarT1-associated NADAR antitoxin family protein n=1 Tax=Psychrobacter sp. AOP7-B1-24 TaxID=3457645 RepID=UPI003FB8172D